MSEKLKIRASLLLPMIAFSSLVSAQSGMFGCGDPFRASYGPFDYRKKTSAQRAIVEDYHFTAAVESLRGGATTSSGPGGDLEYTLNAYPNHHRALLAMMKFALRERRSHPGGVKISIECRFERAERFAPDDAGVKVIHGLYLIRTGKQERGKEILDRARALAPDNPDILYNLGLAYFEIKEYEYALDSAHAAYARGFPLPGLRNKLRRAGKWLDPAARSDGDG